MNIIRRIALLTSLLLLFTGGFAHAQASRAKTTSTTTTSIAPLDINTATADQLKAFNGIGDAYAARIIAARPYTAKNQLLSRGVLPVGAYNKIKDEIIARQPKK